MYSLSLRNLLISDKGCTTISHLILALQSSCSSLLNFLGMISSARSVAHTYSTFRYGIGGMMRGMSVLWLSLETSGQIRTRNLVISIKDVVPRCITIVVHARCSVWGWDSCTEEAQSLLHCVHCVSPSVRVTLEQCANQLSIFFWELFPEWIFPLLTGFSIACLSAPNSVVISQVFGGSNGNEGLGLLSISFDWQVSVN